MKHAMPPWDAEVERSLGKLLFVCVAMWSQGRSAGTTRTPRRTTRNGLYARPRPTRFTAQVGYCTRVTLQAEAHGVIACQHQLRRRPGRHEGQYQSYTRRAPFLTRLALLPLKQGRCALKKRCQNYSIQTAVVMCAQGVPNPYPRHPLAPPPGMRQEVYYHHSKRPGYMIVPRSPTYVQAGGPPACTGLPDPVAPGGWPGRCLVQTHQCRTRAS